MLICIFGGLVSSELEPGTAGISDEQVAESAPMVRALVVSRLEMIWRACEPYILPVEVEDGDLPRRPDPRYVEAGIRVNDRLIALYGLLKPQVSADQEAGTTSEDQQKALEALEQLESRLRPPASPPRTD
jgi:hypothetical protein